MLVFALFCAIVLLSLVIQWLSNRWLLATSIPCLTFAILIFTVSIPFNKAIAFFLGIPMIFFAALLGCFIYETRLNPKRHDALQDTLLEEKELITKKNQIKG